MDDLISRAAIEWHDFLVADGNGMYQYEKVAYKSQIDTLPSAQPEIIRCKDCKHKPNVRGVNHDISFPDEVCPCQCADYWYSWMPKDDWYCANAERRTDE